MDLKERIAFITSEVKRGNIGNFEAAERINKLYCEEIKKHQLADEEITAIVKDLKPFTNPRPAVEYLAFGSAHQIQSILKALGGE